MSLIGTTTGVYKVGTIRRKPDGEQWSKEMIRGIVGSPQQPEPGVGTRRITTFANKKINVDPTEAPVTFEPPVDAPSVPHNVKILKTDVKKHGATPGCAGCRAAITDKTWRSAHTAECRARMAALMMEDDESRARV